jgi:hypothetical protein
MFSTDSIRTSNTTEPRKERTTMRTVRRMLLPAVAVAIAMVSVPSGTLGSGATRAFADYGPSAQYQVELSANAPGQHGGGIWIWTELSPAYPGATWGTGDYSGADCGHGGAGAVSDKGEDTWRLVGGNLVISNIVLNGLEGFNATMTVPATYGHYTGTLGSFISLPAFIPPFIGTSQLQVAP